MGRYVVLSAVLAALTFFVTRSGRMASSAAILSVACVVAARRRKRTKADVHREVAVARQAADVIAFYPASGISPEELLRVAASAASPSARPVEQAIVRAAIASGVSIQRPEDFLAIPGRGIHCWVDDTPTLVGSRPFLTEKGVPIQAPEHTEAQKLEVFVAQGFRFIGSLALADVQQS